MRMVYEGFERIETPVLKRRRVRLARKRRRVRWARVRLGLRLIWLAMLPGGGLS